MTSSKSRAAAGAALLVTLGLAVVALQVVRERQVVSSAPAPQMLYVRSPAVMQRMALSFDALLADVYWMRALQYYGGTRLSDAPEKNYDLLYPLLDLATSLDPAFMVAYRFGAFFLSEPAPGGAGRSDLAVRLLDKARAANPERWEYPYDIAFVYYRLGEYDRAAEWYRQAAAVPDAPEWLQPLVAVMLARGGDRSTARLLWENIRTGSEEPWLQRAAEFRLRQLDAMDQIDALERATRAYEQRTGAPPQHWDDLLRARMLRAIPVDPSGTPYVLNPWWGEVTVSPDSALNPMPEDQPEP